MAFWSSQKQNTSNGTMKHFISSYWHLQEKICEHLDNTKLCICCMFSETFWNVTLVLYCILDFFIPKFLEGRISYFSRITLSIQGMLSGFYGNWNKMLITNTFYYLLMLHISYRRYDKTCQSYILVFKQVRIWCMYLYGIHKR